VSTSTLAAPSRLGESGLRVSSTALAVITAVVLLGSAFPVVKFGLRSYQPGPFALLRFSVASIVLALYAKITRMKLPPRKTFFPILGIGVLVVPAYHLMFNYGVRSVSASGASVLINTGPIWTALLASLLLRERPPGRLWIGLVISFIGAVMIALDSGTAIRLSDGAILIVLAAMIQAASFVAQKPLVERYGALAITATTFWAGTALLIVPFGSSLVHTMSVAPVAHTLAAVWVGAASSAIGLAAWAYVLGRMPASSAAPFLLLVPVSATLLALPLIGELPQPLTIIGGIVTLAGVVIGRGWLRTVRKQSPVDRSS
jgi:drug/metabolite transporter (DMT)-like permease